MQLFDHIASCLENFIKEKKLEDEDEEIPLGFTFSFPVDQDSINSGTLTNWNKGFSASGCVGNDVDVDVDVVALLNDTVGTLLACAFKDSSCQIGVILGTGSNACYMEQLSKCPKLKEYELEKDNLPKQVQFY
ncbi:unnamed protein product [Gongylonema pulchrum]|uniref:Phosphotransferase n=1 Tax=Gongylonema pulchrum TaxID=637853 RepID=A0A183DIP8_9BILA|nr:unnamed protein product [Gongylonema pulchrum]